MRFSKAVGAVLLLSTVSVYPSAGYAGFGYTYLGQKVEEGTQAAPAPQESPSLLGAAAVAAPVAPVESVSPLPLAAKAVAGTSTPALQVFTDRYVPDSIRKKYNLDENWYGKGAAPAVPETPSPSTPPMKTLEVISTAPPVKTNAPVPLSVMDVPAEAPAPRHGTVITIPPSAQSLSGQTPVKQEEIVDSWRARKGENLHDVLQRWSKRGATNLMWATPDAPVIKNDFSFVGKYKEAVDALIKQEGGADIHSQYRSEGMNPIMMTPAATVKTSTPQPPPEEKKAEAPATGLGLFSKVFNPDEKKPVKRTDETRWYGLSGSPLYEVLQVWAEDAGAKLVWQSEKNFALKETVSQVGQFEDAVYKALSQYDGEEIRPVGEVYVDPRTGEKLLLVRTDIK